MRARVPAAAAAAVAAAALVGACIGPTFVVQQYRGPRRSAEEIAILRVNGADSVRLLVLDREDVAAPIAEDGRLHIELLPGRHTVTVADARRPDERFLPLPFDAAAGKVYRVAFDPPGPRVHEVDRHSDRLAADVTVDPSPPAVAPPPPPPPPPTPLDPRADAGVDAATST